jgi:deferrochelatase/peroxidase EfeB
MASGATDLINEAATSKIDGEEERYSYTDAIDPVRGTLLGGLFFIAFMKDPSQFASLQQKLGTSDALNEYIQHTGSALFAVPPGISRGPHWGDDLFA